MADLNEGRLDLPRSRARFVAFGVIALLLFGMLAGRLFHLQVVDGNVYAGRAAAARTVELPVRAPRGLIFDREGRPLVVNTPSWTVKVRPADLPSGQRGTILRRVAQLTGVGVATLNARLDAFSGSPYDLVPIVRGVSREAALVMGEERERLRGIVVEVDPVRRYLDEQGDPNGSLASHVLGYTGPVSREELAAREEDRYLPDDSIGKSGIEASFEEKLRGVHGVELWERDASGRAVKVVRTLSDPTPGTNLMLTIDAEMQRKATEALEWGMDVAGVSQGVTIVMNPQTAEILAMVSLPAYDNNKFATGISAADFQAYLVDPDKPLRNHAIADIYPPGSTYKLVTAIAALQEGVTTPSQRWQTYACYQIPGAPEGDCLYDWNRQGFGPLDITGAFARSSDTFFYQMAIALGIDGMAEWAYQYGFGERTGIRLPGEARGIIASTAWAQLQGRTAVYTGEVAQAGIGQNVIAVTPLQVLNAYAALANGGRLMQPMIVRGETDARGQLVNEYEPELIAEIAASPEHQRLMRVAAREVITSGHAYNIRDLPLPGALHGKTGTAEFGEPLPETGNLPFHSWFVAYLPSEAGGTDAELAVVTFTHSAVVRGNVSLEVVKYFLQKHLELDVDLRLDPNDVSLVSAN
jgi:penicillin-binding protein 2